MAPSKSWTNREAPSKQKRRQKKNKSKKAHRFTTKLEQPSMAKEASSQQVNQIAGAGALSFLENLSKITQGIDLGKLKGQISDLNEVFEQVNGVIKKIGQYQRSPQPPMRGNVGSQLNQPHVVYHPYRGYGHYQSYKPNYPRNYKV